MQEIKILESSNLQIDYLIALIEGRNVVFDPMGLKNGRYWIWEDKQTGHNKTTYEVIGETFAPSKNWLQAGEIVEREKLTILNGDLKKALQNYLFKKLGETVAVPRFIIMNY